MRKAWESMGKLAERRTKNILRPSKLGILLTAARRTVRLAGGIPMIVSRYKEG